VVSTFHMFIGTCGLYLNRSTEPVSVITVTNNLHILFGGLVMIMMRPFSICSSCRSAFDLPSMRTSAVRTIHLVDCANSFFFLLGCPFVMSLIFQMRFMFSKGKDNIQIGIQT